MPEKGIPDGKGKVEANRLLPLLRHYEQKRRDGAESRVKTFGCDACVWGLPHQECFPWAGPPEAHEGQLSCRSGHPGEDQRWQEISCPIIHGSVKRNCEILFRLPLREPLRTFRVFVIPKLLFPNKTFLNI